MNQFQLFEHRLRWLIKDEWGLKYVTFNHGEQYHESRISTSAFTQLHDCYLNGSSTLQLSVPNDAILLPLEGNFNVHGNDDFTIGSGETLLLKSAGIIHVQNGNNEPARILIIETNTIEREGLTSFSLENKNQFYTLLSNPQLEIQLGYFSGRTKFEASFPQSTVFCQNINGAFEVEDRLLEVNDALQNVNSTSKKIEGKALSENAVLLLISF